MRKTTYTLAEAAAILSCHSETLRRAIKDGVLSAARLGREYRISRNDLQTFWSERGGGELFAEDEALPHEPEIPLTAPSTVAAITHTNGPRQLSLLAPQD